MPVGFQLKVKMGSLQQTLNRMISPANQREGYEAGAHAFVRELQESYPPEHHEPQPFVSDAQRRGFFFYLKNGDITVPYIRTDFLKENWTVKPTNGGEGYKAENPAGYASLVQGAQRTRYHQRGGWKTPREIWENTGDAIRKKIRAAMIAAWMRGR